MSKSVESSAAHLPHLNTDLALMDAWWRAANYLSVGQIYLLDNPLLREPLELKRPATGLRQRKNSIMPRLLKLTKRGPQAASSPVNAWQLKTTSVWPVSR